MTGSERRRPLEIRGKIRSTTGKSPETPVLAPLTLPLNLCVSIANQSMATFTSLISVTLYCVQIKFVFLLFFFADLLNSHRRMNIDSCKFSSRNNVLFLSNPSQSHSLAVE